MRRVSRAERIAVERATCLAQLRSALNNAERVAKDLLDDAGRVAEALDLITRLSGIRDEVDALQRFRPARLNRSAPDRIDPFTPFD